MSYSSETEKSRVHPRQCDWSLVRAWDCTVHAARYTSISKLLLQQWNQAASILNICIYLVIPVCPNLPPLSPQPHRCPPQPVEHSCPAACPAVCPATPLLRRAWLVLLHLIEWLWGWITQKGKGKSSSFSFLTPYTEKSFRSILAKTPRSSCPGHTSEQQASGRNHLCYQAMESHRQKVFCMWGNRRSETVLCFPGPGPVWGQVRKAWGVSYLEINWEESHRPSRMSWFGQGSK